jgi:hypothetical protein
MYEAPRLLILLPVGEGWRTCLRARAQSVYKFPRIFSLARGNFEEQYKVLRFSIIIIIIIIIIVIITL